MRNFLLAAAVLAATTTTALATPITIGYTITNQLTAANAPVITTTHTTPFSLDLALNTPQTISLASISETHSNIGTIDADFSFDIFGSTAALALTGVDTEVALTVLGKTYLSNTLVWQSSANAFDVLFPTGAELTVSLANSTYTGVSTGYHGLSVPVTFDLIANPVPEPGSLVLLLTALAGLGSLVWFGRKRGAALSA